MRFLERTRLVIPPPPKREKEAQWKIIQPPTSDPTLAGLQNKLPNWCHNFAQQINRTGILRFS